tara:strand:+ start:550 stop:882 length:333 start_codon:yes stop_codon:yes gene_type:complete
MIDIDKYKGHTEAPWLELEVDKVVAYQFDENDNPKMICNVFRDGDGGSAYEGGWGDNEVEANQKLIADAPLFLAEVKRLREGIKQLIVRVEGMLTGYRKPIVKALKEMIE